MRIDPNSQTMIRNANEVKGAAYNGRVAKFSQMINGQSPTAAKDVSGKFHPSNDKPIEAALQILRPSR